MYLRGVWGSSRPELKPHVIAETLASAAAGYVCVLSGCGSILETKWTPSVLTAFIYA